MGTHYRRGHYRRGKDGTLHWVSGHEVRRTSGGFDGPIFIRSKNPRERQPRSATLPASRFGYARTIARPNATCPVCGASVYFYSNSHGSKVYFDDLGPPWPKHPCMDRRGETASTTFVPGLSQVFSSSGARSDALPLLSQVRDVLPAVRERREYLITYLWPVQGGLKLRLRPANGPRGAWSCWFSAAHLNLQAGDGVFLADPFGRSATLSYVDQEELRPVNVLVQRTETSFYDYWRTWRHVR